MARDILVILIVAVEPERVFSESRALIDYKCYRISGQTIENLLVLKL